MKKKKKGFSLYCGYFYVTYVILYYTRATFSCKRCVVVDDATHGFCARAGGDSTENTNVLYSQLF